MHTDSPVPSAQPINYHAHVPSDDPDKARMRFHQSWFRHHFLRESPGLHKGAPLGSRLSPEASRAGANLLHRDALAAAIDRYGKPSEARLWSNLLTSEALCFNLFAPMAANLPMAARALRRCGLAVVHEVERIQFEFAPDPKAEPKTQYLDDNTSFDAFVEFRDQNGQPGFLGIETKLTEPFSLDSYAFDTRYARWMSSAHWCWKAGTESNFASKTTNQLWRNQLLCVAMRDMPTPGYQHAYSIAIAPEIDHSAADSAKAYEGHLKQGAPFKFLTLETVWDALWQEATSPDERTWLRLFHLRYLDLATSEPAWRETQGVEARVPSLARAFDGELR